MKLYRNKEWLNKAYQKDQLTQQEIANLTNTTKTNIRNWMKKFNIPRRNPQEARSLESYKKKMMGENNPFWGKGKNGKGVRITGKYRYIYMPSRKKYSYNNYFLEHHMVAEKALGRYMKTGEIIHHINGNSLDNRNCNLLICTKGYHTWLHQKMSNLYMKEHFGG